ncbi:MAG: hypothetical protein OHK005_19420 [Candidatus Methylacidiphilales bacterium]
MTLRIVSSLAGQGSGKSEHPIHFLVRGRSHRAQLRERVNECWDVMFPHRVPLQTGEERRR